ncbi:hypothetical protein D3C86_1047050 [compost metagenome]
MSIAFLGDGERGAHLHAICAVGQPVAYLVMATHAARHNQFGRVAAQLQFIEQRMAVGQHALEIKAFVVNVGNARGAQMAARIAGVFDHHSVGHPAFFHPFFQHNGHAARFGQDRHQRYLGKVRRHLGQVHG